VLLQCRNNKATSSCSAPSNDTYRVECSGVQTKKKVMLQCRTNNLNQMTHTKWSPAASNQTNAMLQCRNKKVTSSSRTVTVAKLMAGAQVLPAGTTRLLFWNPVASEPKKGYAPVPNQSCSAQSNDKHKVESCRYAPKQKSNIMAKLMAGAQVRLLLWSSHSGAMPACS
jgi:archaellum component FlaF (FlaF/FlaG flagellin family)